MFQKLITKDKHYLDGVLHFSLAECKNYRKIHYHNWSHGFAVTKNMFIMKTRQHRLTPLEC